MSVSKGQEAIYWDQIAKRMVREGDVAELLYEQYRRVHFNLVTKWAGSIIGKTILKTDLFAEALEPFRAFLWDILEMNGDIIGIDISSEITSQARIKAAQYAPNSPAEYITSDVRQLPFSNDSFDLIISDSTLDHFHHKKEIIAALSELSRVLQPGGVLIITMDNKTNLTDPFLRLWIFFKLHHFFIGKTYSIGELEKSLTDAGLRVMDSTAIIHSPRFFTRKIIALINKVDSARCNRLVRRGLALLESLEKSRARYLTAQFIAAKAVKPAE